MRREELDELHYITPIANLPSILRLGVLSHDWTRNLPHASVARPEIQDVRAKVAVPGGRPLHEYVNLYFHARNPMLSARDGEHAALCVLRIRPDVLDVSGAVVTDRNAASGYVRWAAAPQGIAIVDGALAFAGSWEHPGDLLLGWRHRLVKCAELLVPDRVAPGFISGVYVSGTAVRDRLRGAVPQLPVVINADLFFGSEERGMALAAPTAIADGSPYAAKAQARTSPANGVGAPGKAIMCALEQRRPVAYDDRAQRRRGSHGPLGCPYGSWQAALLRVVNLPTRQRWRPAFSWMERRSMRHRGSDAAMQPRPGWIALVETLARLECEPYRWPVCRLRFAQIAYFASALGIPTGFHYARGNHGPVLADVQRSVTRLLHSRLVREERQGSTCALRTGPTYPDVARVYRTDLEAWEPLLERLVDLFLRMPPRESEVAATVLFTALCRTKQGALPPSELDLFEAVQKWKERHQAPFQDEEIGLAVRHLNMLGWLIARPSTELPLPASELLVLEDFGRRGHSALAG